MDQNENSLGNTEREEIADEMIIEEATESADDLETLLNRFTDADEPQLPPQKKKKKSSANKIILQCVAAVLCVAIGVGGTLGFQAITKKTDTSSQEKTEANEKTGENLPAIEKTADMDYVMTFEGEKIGIEEYKFMQYLTRDDAVALEVLQVGLVFLKEAKRHNITLTEEAYVQWKEAVDGYKSAMEEEGMPIPELSDERMVDFLAAISGNTSAEGNYNPAYDLGYIIKLKEKIAEGIDIEPDEYELLYKDYLFMMKQNHAEGNVNVFFAMTKEPLEKAVEAMNEGMSFEEAVKEFDEMYSEEEGVQSAPVSTVPFATGEDLDTVVNLSIGDVSPIITFSNQGNEFYGILQATEEFSMIDESEVRVNFERDANMFYDYVTGYSDEQLYKLIDEADFEINQIGLDYVNSLNLYY